MDACRKNNPRFRRLGVLREYVDIHNNLISDARVLLQLSRGVNERPGGGGGRRRDLSASFDPRGLGTALPLWDII